MSKCIPAEVLGVLSELAIEGEFVRIAQALDRGTYLAVDKVLQALGGKWNRRHKAHVFEGNPCDRIEHAILTASYESPRDYGFFPTPHDIACKVVKAAGLRDGMSVLEPSAGTGSLVSCAMTSAKVQVRAVELQRDHCAKLAGLPGVRVTCGDFLACPIEAGFDRVLMNPPFGKLVELAHVQRAFDWLRPHGRLVSVLPSGVTFRQDRRTVEFRTWLDAHNGSIEPLPDGAFKPSGTAVRTVLVCADK